jgi:two-component system, cell cycle sensor histidine kinase and response regulator CckA
VLVKERVGIILLFGCAFVPLFGLADYLLYPEHLFEFLTYRLIAAACCLALYMANRQLAPGSRSFHLGMAAAYVVGFSIVAMVVRTGGYSTPYYAGLGLVFLGMGTVLPAKTASLVWHSAILYGSYLLSVLLFAPLGRTSLFLVNNMFLASTVVMALLANRVDVQLRLREFVVRRELEGARLQLERYSKDLENLFTESENMYQVVVDNAAEAIFVLQDNVMKFPNPKAVELFGYPKEELATIPFLKLVPEEDRHLLPVQEEHAKGGPKTVSGATFRVVQPSGKTLWADMSAVSIDWIDRPAFLVFLRDVTEKRMMEDELVHAQKMEAVGTLAGGMAHDFNNLLTGISGYTSLMLLHRDAANPDYERLRSIEQLVRSGANLTRQLLGFARGGRFEVKPTDLNQLVRDSLSMFARTKREIAVHEELQAGIHTVEVDRGQIEQVLLNLFVNAWQAMPEGGDLFVATRNVHFDSGYAAHHSMTPGDYLRISVTDTGIGMDRATQQRVFEPFFTTKEMGRGTGLGLSSAYGIVRNHGGLITVYSEVGKGTTFNVYLPASKRQVVAEETNRIDIVPSTGRILLIDDDETILAVGKEMLEALGYDVFVAASGQEALRLYKENRDRIDIVVLDLIMPEMSGSETYDRLKVENADLRVILSSGYSMNDQTSSILERGCKGFIQKPFNMNDLSEKIREVLEA